jgi:hypothetical protein
MRTIVIAGLTMLAACERVPIEQRPAPTRPVAHLEVLPPPPPPVTPLPAPRPHPHPPGSPPPPGASLPRPASDAGGRTARRPGPLPEPPSLEPAAYTAWLRALPRADQQRIAAFCRHHRQDLQPSCGGIGPLHVPYPPFGRVRAWREGDATSLFASVDDWQASLSAGQRAYVDHECQGGEDRPSSDLCGDNTPLVISFDDQPVTFAPGGRFAFQPDALTATDWPTATTPWLALDGNHDGVIDRGAELFGSDTVLPDGTTATNGFVALAALDANHDGVIDARDPAFADLVLWADRDHDQRGPATELTPAMATLVAISLASRVVPRCDARCNCEGERADLTWRDAADALHHGAIVDVYLPRR